MTIKRENIYESSLYMMSNFVSSHRCMLVYHVVIREEGRKKWAIY